MKSVVAFFVLGTLLLSGCRGKAAENLEPVTLRLGLPLWVSYVDPLLQQAVDRFHQEHPNVTVEIESLWGNDYGDIADRVADEQPDVFMGWPSFRLIEGDQPLALNLDSFVGGADGLDTADFFPGLLDAFRWQGGLYAIPASLDVQLMYYNRDLFDAQGVAYPQADWTWQDFLAAAQQLTTASGEGDQLTGHWGFVSHPISLYRLSDLFPFVAQHGGRLLDDSTDPPRPVFDDPRVAEAIQWYADLGLVHRVMPIVQRDQVDEMSSAPSDVFALQRAAMVIGGFSQRGGDYIRWNFNWSAVPLPRDQAKATWVWLTGYYIGAATAHPQESWALVRSLAESETGTSSWNAPARRSVVESAAFRQQNGEEMTDALLAMLDEDVVKLVYNDRFWGEWMQPFEQAAYRVVTGSITAQEMMDELRAE